MENSNATTNPMDSGLKLQKDEGESFNDVKEYRRIVGSLLYLTITRPNITFLVGIISQFMERPCVDHMATAKRILRYVKGTLDYGLFYQNKIVYSLQGYIDVDWGGNVTDRRSTTSHCFSFGSTVIS